MATEGVEGVRVGVDPDSGWAKSPGSSGRTTRTAYDRNGNAWLTQDSDGTLTKTEFDALDRPRWVSEGYRVFGSSAARTTGTGYDAAGNVEWTTDGNGTKTTYGYDKLGRRTSVTEAAGTDLQRTTLYAFDKVGRVTWEWAPVRFGTESTLALLNPQLYRVGTRHQYDDAARIETVTEAAKLPLAVALPALGHDAPATVTHFDLLGRTDLVTDPLGRRTKTEYDALGRVSEVVENWTGLPFDAGVTGRTSWTYDAADNVREVTRGGALSGIVDGAAPWQSVTDRYTYDVLNRRTKTEQAVAGIGFAIGPNGPVVTQTKYDALDRVLWTYDPNGNGTGFTYSAFDEVLQVREGGGYVAAPFVAPADTPPTGYLRYTDHTYDDAGRLTSTTEDRFTRDGEYAGKTPPRVTTEYGYDALGRETSVTEAKGDKDQRTTRFTYDGNDRLLTTVEPLTVTGVRFVPVAGVTLALPVVMNRTTRNTYDALGRLVAVTEADGLPGWSRTTSMGYDAADNVVWTATPRKYDFAVPTGEPVPAVSAAGAVLTVNQYDALNRRTKTTSAANATTSDLAGYESPVTEWKYDAVGRVNYEIGPADASDSTTRLAVGYTYDSRDQVTHRTDLRWGPDGPTVLLRQDTFAYDGFGHVLREVDGIVAPGFAADAGPQRLSQTDYRYDALGLLRTTTESLDASTVRLTQNWYDADGNVALTSVSQDGDNDPNNKRTTKFTYDSLNRKQTVTEAWDENQDFVSTNLTGVSLGKGGYGSPVTRYEYDARDNVIAVTDPRGLVSRSVYDALGRLVEAQAAVNAVQFESLGLGAFGELLFPGPVTKWKYDAADRLVLVTDANGVSTKYAYDAHNNKTAMTEAVGKQSERTTESSYDAAGNLVALTTGLSPWTEYQHVNTTAYSFDALGRQAKVVASTQLAGASPWQETKYDAAADVVAVRSNTSTPTEPRVSVTAIGYDLLHRAVRWTEGSREIASGALDGSGARVTYAHYDSADDVIRQWDNETALREYEYDNAGRVTKVWEGAGSGAGPFGDPVLNKSAANLANLQINSFAYNVFGEVTRETTPLGQTVSTYDRLGRLQKTQPNELQWTVNKYDVVGNLVSVTDTVRPSWYAGQAPYPAGQSWNPDDVVTDKAVVNETRTSYDYDVLGHLVRQTDTRGQSRTVKYTPTGLVSDTTDRNWQELGAGKLTSRRVHVDYDDLGRQVAELWYAESWNRADGTLTLTGSEFAGGYQYVYNAADDEVAGWNWTVGKGADGKATKTAEFRYDRTFDALDRLKTEATPFGVSLTYEYSTAGQLTGVTDDKGGSLNSDYDSAGRLTARRLTTPGNVGETFKLEYQRDGRGNLSDRVDHIDEFATPTPAAKAVPALRITQGYDGHGRIGYLSTGPVNGDGTTGSGFETFGYKVEQSTGRVQEEHRHTIDPSTGKIDGTYTYATTYSYSTEAPARVSTTTRFAASGAQVSAKTVRYDAAGMEPRGDSKQAFADNQKAAQATPQGVLGGRQGTFEYAFGTDKAGTKSWQEVYDGEGNVVQQTATLGPVGKDGKRTAPRRLDLGYDFRNQLVVVREGHYTPPNPPEAPPPFVPDSTIEYTYNGHGQLIQSSQTWADGSRATDQFVYAGDQLYADRDGSSVVTRYVVADDGTRLGRVDAIPSKGLFLYATDKFGSIASVYQAAPGQTAVTWVEAVAYNGVGTDYDNTWTATGFADWFGHSGRLEDDRLGFQWTDGRWLDPKSEQFVAESPSGRADGEVNLYKYAPGSDAEAPKAPKVAPRPTDDLFVTRWSGSPATVRPISNLERTKRTWAAVEANPGKFGRGVVAGVTFGLSEAVRDHDQSKWTVEERRAFMAGEITGVGITLVASLGALGMAARVGTIGRLARGVVMYDTAGNLYTAGKSAQTIAQKRAAGEKVTVLDGLGLLGGLAGAGGNLAALGRAGKAGALGRTAAATEQWVFEKLTRAGHGVAQPLVWVGVHGVAKRVASAERYAGARAWAQRNGFRACFAAGTPIQWEHGAKPVERCKSYEEYGDNCDRVVSRDEHNADGVLTLRRVLRTFRRTGLIFDLKLPDGITIGTTAEHPFFVRNKGWTPAQGLQPGDELALMASEWVTVEGVEDTGRVETVYNLEVEDDHTYFVGCDEWGFSVWAHNLGCDDFINHLESTGKIDPARAAALRSDPAFRQLFESYALTHGEPASLAQLENRIAQAGGKSILRPSERLADGFEGSMELTGQGVRGGLTNDDIRLLPGTAHGGLSLPEITGPWLANGSGPFPGQIARLLHGRDFSSFKAFRMEFWRLVARDTALAPQFGPSNLPWMLKGGAPTAPKAFQLGGGGANKKFNLDHINALEEQASLAQARALLYDMDNLQVLAPRWNQAR